MQPVLERKDADDDGVQREQEYALTNKMNNYIVHHILPIKVQGHSILMVIFENNVVNFYDVEKSMKKIQGLNLQKSYSIK